MSSWLRPRLPRFGSRLSILALLMLVLLAVAGCGAGEPDAPTYVVEMRDNVFEPAVLRVPVGARVSFVNVGRAPHNALDSDDEWSTTESFGNLIMLSEEETTLVFNQPGVYPYFCSFHGTAAGAGMAARIIVGDVEDEAVAAAEASQPAQWTGVTRNVPDDYPTIQSAVDAADAGDLVLVQPGVYKEQVTVSTDNLVIRGVDRNTVIIDGEFQRDNGVFVVGANGVAVENLTVRDVNVNGIFWTGVTGYRASYITAIDAYVYGIYAFDSVDGLIEHSYASGSSDSGIYVGQCDPCNAVVDDVVAEYNALGYSGTNSSRQMYILNSIWRYNGAGIAPNTLDGEKYAPVHDVTIVGNLVYDNGNTEVPFRKLQWPLLGNGIALMGNKNTLVERNRVVNQPANGILVSAMLDDNFYTSDGNIVRENVVSGSGRADLALGGPAGPDNCFDHNQVGTSLPPALDTLLSCSGLRLPLRHDLVGFMDLAGRAVEAALGMSPDHPAGYAPKPGPQATMPGGADAPVQPAVDVFANYPLDLDAITVPDMPDDIRAIARPGFTLFGVHLGYSTYNALLGLFGWFLIASLYAAWTLIALWELTSRAREWGAVRVMGWTGAIMVVPFLGVIGYFILGKSAISAWKRAFILIAPLLAYIGVVVGMLLGSGAL